MDNRAQAILKTLLYSDIFDYPLTKEELYRFIIEGNLKKEEIDKLIKTFKLPVEYKRGYLFLKGRQKLINIRKNRQGVSNLKLKKANKIIKKITFIPTIKLIGISGALSMRNSDKDDDIDIFVITEKKLVWTTRILLVTVLKLLGVYRGRTDKSYSDKICLNMIIAEDKINFYKKNRNLYTAHEIVQLIPVFERDETFRKFAEINSWVKSFLPNGPEHQEILIKKKKTIYDKLIIYLLNLLFLERVLGFIQYRFMQKNINKEVIEEGFLGFHPFNYKNHVLKIFNQKLKEHNLKKSKKN